MILIIFNIKHKLIEQVELIEQNMIIYFYKGGKRMKCRNCGNELGEGDTFCQNCGTKIDIQSEKKQQKKSKKKYIIIGCFILLLAVAVCIYFFIPNEMKLEVQELADAVNNNTVSEYYSKELVVHGYLVRDNRSYANNEDDEYYIFVSDTNDWQDNNDFILIKYSDGLDDDFGTGTELIVSGELQEDSNILLANQIDVKKSVERTYNVNFKQLSEENYANKKISITGRMIDLLGEGHYLTDAEINYSVQLKGITESKFADYFKNGSMAIVTGTFNDDETLTVESIEQTEVTKDSSYNFGMSVNECYNTYLTEGQEITLNGTYIKNSSASIPYAIQDEETGQFIALSVTNESIDLDEYFESGEQCVITGNISEGGSSYILYVTAIG